MDLLSLDSAALEKMADTDILGLITRITEALARLEALRIRAVNLVDSRRDRARSVPGELSPALRETTRTTARIVELAHTLCTRMPSVLQAMAEGNVSQQAASRIAHALNGSPDHIVAQVDDRISQCVAGRNPVQIRRATRELVNTLDPLGTTTRAKRKRQLRGVHIQHGDSTTSTLRAHLSAEVALAIYARLTHTAKDLQGPDEHRDLDQLRADVFSDILAGEDKGHPPVQPEVFLHLPIDAALGISDRACELVGHGTIPAPIAREIMTDPNSTWRRVLTDSRTGKPLAVDSNPYYPKAREGHTLCTFWGCRRPAGEGDLCTRHKTRTDLHTWKYRHDPETQNLTIIMAEGLSITTTLDYQFPPFATVAAPTSHSPDTAA